MNWNDWILQKNAEFVLDKMHISKDRYLSDLNKAYVFDSSVERGDCNCGAHAVKSHHHSDWCDGLNHKPKIKRFLDQLNSQNKKLDEDVGDGHGSYNLMDDPRDTHGDTFQAGDLSIYSDHGDDMDNPRHINSANPDYFNKHVEDRQQEIHDHMDSLGYAPVDFNDGSGNGLYYWSTLYRKKALAKSDEFWNKAYKTLSTLHDTKPKSLDQVKAWDTGLSKLMDIWKKRDVGAWNTAMDQLKAGQAARKTGQPNVAPSPVNKAPGSY